MSRSQTEAVQIGGSLSAAKEKSRQGDTLNNAVRASDTQAALRELAEDTGGFLIANTTDYRKSFQRLLDDIDIHFEASYRPTSEKYDGRLRKIEVKPVRADLHVDSRTGYFAMPDLKGGGTLQPYETTGLALLNLEPAPHDFDVRAVTFEFGSASGTTRHALVFEIPGTSLGARAIAERQSHAVHASLLALVKGADGQIVDKFSVDAPYEIPDANLAAVRSGAMTHSHATDLAPGRYASRPW